VAPRRWISIRQFEPAADVVFVIVVEDDQSLLLDPLSLRHGFCFITLLHPTILPVVCMDGRGDPSNQIEHDGPRDRRVKCKTVRQDIK